MPRAPVICMSHGGGPLPVLGDPSHKEIIRSFKSRVPKILKLGTPDAPRAIIVITAHWSEDRPTISSNDKHALYFDYYGFQPEAYQLRYDAPGSAGVAEEVRRAFEEEGLKPVMDPKRGWDHGVFIPFILVNPAADVPIIQVSVLNSEDPQHHFMMGRALGKLRDSNIAIVGSGFASVHNMQLMRTWLMSGSTTTTSSTASTIQSKYDAWQKTLTDAVLEEKLDDRLGKMSTWREFPGSYEMHPRGGGEHFMPLLVCVAAAGDGKAGSYSDRFGRADIWSYYWSD